MRRTACLMLAVVCSAIPGWLAAQTSSSADYTLESQSFGGIGMPADGTPVGSAGYSLSLVQMAGVAPIEPPSSQGFVFVPGGSAVAYAPPGEVAGACDEVDGCLTFADADSLQWPAEPSAGTYRLYRAPLDSIVGSGFGACQETGISVPGTTDADPVPSGDGFFYLVTVVNRLGEEGIKGRLSDGTQRPNLTPCP